MSKKKVRTLEQKNAWIGRGFMLPFYLGFIFFFFLEQSEKEVVILHKTEKRSAKDAENVK